MTAGRKREFSDGRNLLTAGAKPGIFYTINREAGDGAFVVQLRRLLCVLRATMASATFAGASCVYFERWNAPLYHEK